MADSPSRSQGGDVFIVDNSDKDWKVRRRQDFAADFKWGNYGSKAGTSAA